MMSVFTILTNVIYSFLLLQSHSAKLIYFAELPETVTALTGSCLQIPCTFNLSDFTKKLNKAKHIYGIWQKGDTSKTNVTVFNSSIIGGSSKIQMIGNLSERNCTTVFYNISESQTGFYYFRLQMEPDVFRATFNANKNNPNSSVFKPVKINVTDLPERPKLNIVSGKQTVMEGSTVTLKCSAEALCPQQSPNISWFNFPESADIKPQRREIKPDQTQSVFSEMTFTASDMDHKTNISCTVTYPKPTSTGSVEETMMLRVAFPPKETRVFIKPSESVSVGSEVTLICRSKMSQMRTNNSTFIWFRSDCDKPLEHGKNFRFNVTQNDAGFYHCVAVNKHGNKSSAQVLLTVRGTILFPVILSCTSGALAFLFAGICILYTSRKKSQTKQDQSVDNNTATFCQSDDVISSTENQEDELYYGEINFSVLEQRKAEKESNASVYSEVLDRNKPSSSNMEDIYAQVKNK